MEIQLTYKACLLNVNDVKSMCGGKRMQHHNVADATEPSVSNGKL